MSDSHPQEKVWTSYTQLLGFSTSFLLVFTGYSGSQNLESSLDLGEVNGTLTLGFIYGFFTVSCVFSPIFLEKFGCKTCIFVQYIFMSLYVASNIYPRTWTMYPAAALLGMGAGPLWTANGTLIEYYAHQHERRNHHLRDVDDKGLFNGTFYAIFQFSQITGNLLSSTILGQSKDSKHPSGGTVALLFTVYLSLMASGFLTLCFVPGKNQTEYEQLDVEESPSIYKLFTGFFKFLNQPRYLCLVLLTIASGLEMGFIYSDFPRDVIKDALGTSSIGYLMIGFGVSNVLASFCLGKVMDIVGYVPVVLVGCISQILVCIFLYGFWDKNDWNQTETYIWILGMACLWGIGDATWNTCLSTINTNWFKNDIVNASSNLKFWQSLGCTIAFVYSTLLSFHIRLIIVGSSLVLGVIGFLFAQMLHNNKLQNEINEVLRNGIKADSSPNFLQVRI